MWSMFKQIYSNKTKKGDCCQTTCVSTLFVCGYNGYNCKDPNANQPQSTQSSQTPTATTTTSSSTQSTHPHNPTLNNSS